MKEQLTTTEIEVVYDYLQNNNIKVNSSFAVSEVNNNYALHDGESVFVKVLGSSGDRSTFEVEVAVAEQVSYAPKPLLPVIDSNGLTFTVWQYVPHSKVKPSKANLVDIGVVLDSLRELHKISLPKTGQENKKCSLLVPLARLEAVKAFAPEELWLNVSRLVEIEMTKLSVSINSEVTDLVLVHSDVSFSNMIRRKTDKQLIVVDHESVHINSPLYDAAVLYRCVVQLHGRLDLWNAVEDRFKMYLCEEETLINSSTFQAMVWFKNIMGLTYLMRKGDWGLATERYSQITKGLKQNQLPCFVS